MNITLKPIGTIFSPFENIEGMPIQPKGAAGVKGSIELKPEYLDGLSDLEGFSHLILIYHLHRISNYKLSVIPFLDTVQRGIFATRSPRRPNAIGISVVELTSIEGNTLYIERIDVLNMTPLLDIKPYIPEFDKPTSVRTGWYENVVGQVESLRSDDRFKT